MGQSAASLHEDDVPAGYPLVAGLDRIIVRPLSLADWVAYRVFVGRLDRDDLRLRFAGPVKLDDSRCRRFLDIDHDREEAFAAFDTEGAMLGVARLARVSPGEADIALIVRSDLKRRGLGRLLLDRLIRYADATGLSALRGDVLYENIAMLQLAQRAGFRFIGNAGLMVQIRKELGMPAAGTLWAAGAARPALRPSGA